MSIAFDHSTLGQRVLFGSEKALEHTVAAISGLGAERVLMIGSKSSSDLSDQISSQSPIVAHIHEIVQHVPIDRARAAVELAERASIDAVVAIGGGSSTGLAKIVARDTGLPIIAVPTTFAGSEATNVWGLTEGKRKQTGSDDRVLPKVVVYDATLSTSLPGSLAAASGLNAVAHAVDGFWAPRVDPINMALASEGIGALIPGLRALAKNSGNLEARERMLYGAYLAAVAFASSGSGMHHKICHVLGGAYGLSHSEMHSVVLPYVTAFNAPAAPEAANRISQALGGSPAASGLYDLRREVGVASSLAELGMREEDIPEASELVVAAVPESNPRPVTQHDMESLLRAAWAGTPIEE